MVKWASLILLWSCASVREVRKHATLYFLDVAEKRMCTDLFDSSTCQPIDPNGRYLVMTYENFLVIAEKLEECRIK